MDGNCSASSSVDEEHPDVVVNKELKRSRRSSLFQERFSANSNKQETSKRRKSSYEEIFPKENEIKQYMCNLNKELEEWKATYTHRKKELKKEVRKPVETLGKSNCYELLNEEEKQFLQDAPDYEALNKQYFNTCEAFDISADEVQQVSHLINSVTNVVEAEINNIKCHIIDFCD